jgi:hypothetical protein
MKFNNTSKIIRVKHSQNFTQLSNDMLRDKNLSWKGKGLLACIISLPDEWVVLKTALHQFSKDGRDGTISAFNELIDNGYVKQLKIRDEKGKFVRVDYIVSDVKITINPITDIPKTDKPKTDTPKSDEPKSENPHVINNIETNTLEINNIEVNNVEVNTTSVSYEYTDTITNTITEDEYIYLINSIKSAK